MFPCPMGADAAACCLMANRKTMGCVVAVLAAALCLSVLFNVVNLIGQTARSAMLLQPQRPKFDEEWAQSAYGDGKTNGEKIVQLSLRGIISSSIPGNLGETMVDDLKLQLQQAVDDHKVKAIVLVVDSPGGEVTASDVMYQAVAKAREKKPVVIYMDSLAASGGYYVACGGSYSIANETTFTGSIGVIMQTLQYRGLFEKVGLEMVTIKSGKFKDMLSGSRPITEEERAYAQGLVMQTYEKFVGIVARERKLEVAPLRDGVADGRIVSGKDALENKLIDQLGTLEDAYAKAMELGNAPGAAVVRYDAGFKLSRLFRILGESKARGPGKVEISLTEGMKPKLEVGRLYYLPELFAQ